MHTPELAVLKALLKKDAYDHYRGAIDNAHLKENLKEIHRVYQYLDQWWTKHPQGTELTLEELEVYFWHCNPHIKAQDKTPYELIFAGTKAAKYSEEMVRELLTDMRNRADAAYLSKLSYAVAAGTEPQSALSDYIQKLSSQSDAPADDIRFVSDDLEELVNAAVHSGGLKWRLPSLNKRLGPLRRGNFGIVFARVETGKTTFLASEASYFALQSDRPVLWFNNEEVGENVKLRAYQAHFGVDLPTLLGGQHSYSNRFKEEIQERFRLVDEASIGKSWAERVIRHVNPSIIIFDQLDKIRGFDADRPDLVLGKIYAWARELAKTYAPVIGVCQADGSAENVKYLTMTNMAESKTSKPAEADWILGIGKVSQEGYEYVRYLNLCKNKLVGSDETDPSLRHDKWEVLIEPSIARYRDIGDE